MKRSICIIALLTAAALLCGCSRIPSLSSADSLLNSDDGSSRDLENTTDAGTVNSFTVSTEKYIKKLEAEKGSTTGKIKDFPQEPDSGSDSSESEAEGGENEGGIVETPPADRQYVKLALSQQLTQIANIPSPQFYRVIIAARSEKGASIKLEVGDTVQGAYFVKSDVISDEFGFYAIDNLYLPIGLNTLQFTVGSGEADIDYIIVENSEPVKNELYGTGNSCVSPGSSEKTITLMRTLAENYGKATFSAQNVTCGTNAEIDAVFAETKRYPAIRGSELAELMKGDKDSAALIKADIELAIDWRKNDGICAYTFHWYSPNALRKTELGAFDPKPVFANVDPEELAKLDDDAIKYQLSNKILSEDGAMLLNDLDKLAGTLKELEAADVPVLFSPIPDADADLFWWGADAESYKNLWKLMFLRLCDYHGLKNLIWVWNNSSFSYYPGDRFVDIIGQSFYEHSDSSFAGRFSVLASDTSYGRKMLAVTACDVLPNVNYIFRDNAVWLWCAVDSGEYVLNAAGKFSEKYNKRASLIFTYNNDKCVTRDELMEMWVEE